MSIDVLTPDRIPMSQKERDVLKILHAVLRGERTQAEAARLLGLSTRQVRRLQRTLEAGGDAALVHGLRGKPSNHQPDPELRQAVLAGLPPTLRRLRPHLRLREAGRGGPGRLPPDAASLAARRGPVAAAAPPRPAPQPPTAPRLLRRVGADGRLDPRLAGGPRRGRGPDHA